MNKEKSKKLLALIILFLAFPLSSDADTIVSPVPISDSQIWNLGGSPYIVDSDVVITNTGALNIEAGVEVKMRGGKGIYVSGTLNVSGTEASKVFFTAQDDGSITHDSLAGRWSGMVFNAGSRGDINYLDTKYAGVYIWPNPSGPMIYNLGGEVAVKNSKLYKTLSDAMYLKSGTTTIENTTIDENAIGINFESGYLSLMGSTVSNSDSYGFVSSNYAPGKFFARNNIFSNNKNNTFLDLSIDSDIASTTFVGGDASAWTAGGNIAKEQSIPAGLYHLTGIGIQPGGKLILNPGTTLKLHRDGYILNYGELQISGTEQSPVLITSVSDDSAGGDTNNDGPATSPYSSWHSGIQNHPGSTALIDHALIKYAGEMQTYGPHLFAHASIFNNGGDVAINDSVISNNDQVGIFSILGTTTVKRVTFDEIPKNILVKSGKTEISDSRFILSSYGIGIQNSGPDMVKAENNWWNDPKGPYHPTLNPAGNSGLAVSDNVDFTPWLTADPSATTTSAECCSNVLFLPGFMASDLYVQGSFSENKLWPPNSLLKTDVEKLMLDSNGNSITPGIYTKEIISEAFGFNVYKSFIQKMDYMVSQKEIEEWEPFPYDWRKDTDKVVNESTIVKVGNNFENKKLIDEAVALAQRSPTGKITIVGHSNGGLVGKALIKELQNQGKASIVDQFVMVATPQIGTPKAIAGLLHGDKQEIPEYFGLILDKDTARKFGYNMQSAYNLLPSKSYFNLVSDPVIKFNDSINQVFNYSANGFQQSISSYNEMFNFLTLNNRGTTLGGSINVPSILRSDLANEANSNIEALANWPIPSNIKVYEIAGWGEQTIKGVEYRSKQENTCSTQGGLYICQPQNLWDRKLLMTEDGDGTVVIPSATNYNTPNEYYLNLFDLNNAKMFNLKHHNILEASQLLETLSKILKNNPDILSDFISTQKPISTNQDLQLSVHSPVSLGVYSNNLYTGPSSTSPTDAFTFIREEIPNSYYLEIGEDKYIGLTNGENYTVNLQGEGTGTFTFTQEIIQGEQIIDSKSFVGIPVIPSTKASLSIDSGNLSPNLILDVDGNGSADVRVQANSEFDPVVYLTVTKSIVKSFNLKKSQENNLIKKIDNLIKLIQNSKIKKASAKAEVYVKKLNLKLQKFNNNHKKKENKKLTGEEIQIIIQNLEEFINNLK